ncbi:MAG TPA: flagellar basal body L-ring protein FlgH, partial [Verrucomicrobiae bacterium]|nr:flagellar basal body L-ring protein FlgH [Verrucomicrobiae bacterium]
MKNKTRIQLSIALLAVSFSFQTAVQAQSLWRDDVVRPMFADKRGANVGDIITIVVQENTTASKNNETKTEKNSGLTAAVSSFLYPGFLQYKGSMPAIQYNSDIKHDGSGAINNSETIVAHVAV